MTRQFRTWGLLALLFASVAPLHAQKARWVETNSWEGKGSRQTEIFFVTADHWRVIYRPKGRGTFRMVLNRESGHEPVVVSSQKGPAMYAGRRSYQAPGRRYLDISSSGAEWKVVVEQLLNPLQEWRLVQLLKKDRPRLSRIATWTGGEGEDEFEVRIPRGSWKLFTNVVGDGQLDVSVSPVVGDDGEILALGQLPAGDASSWVHRSGTFRVRTRATGKCEWRLDVCIAN